MDAADVHAYVLIGTIVVPAAAAGLWFEPPRIRRIGAGAILAVVLTLSGSLYIAPRAAGAEPFIQWLLPALSLFFVVPLIRPHLLRLGLFAAVLAFGLALSLQYDAMTRAEWGYIGTSDLPREWARIRGDESAAVRAKLRALAEVDQTEYAPGFFDEPPLNTTLASYLDEPLRGETYAVERCWHSPLSRIYRLKTVQVALWYPGGKLSEGAHGVGFRPRETSESDQPPER